MLLHNGCSISCKMSHIIVIKAYEHKSFVFSSDSELIPIKLRKNFRENFLFLLLKFQKTKYIMVKNFERRGN